MKKMQINNSYHATSMEQVQPHHREQVSLLNAGADDKGNCSIKGVGVRREDMAMIFFNLEDSYWFDRFVVKDGEGTK